MNDSPALDDFERDLARTLHTKATQLAVPDTPESLFAPDAGPAVPLPSRPATVRRERRRGRALALAAATAVLLGAVALTQAGDDRTADRASDVDMPTDLSTGAVRAPAPTDVVGMLPATVPDGWALSSVFGGPVHEGANETLPQTWRAFTGGGPAPVAEAVVVGALADPEPDLPDIGLTVTPAEESLDTFPAGVLPPGSFEAWWLTDGVTYRAYAWGLSREELVAFLDSLTLAPTADPAAGVTAPVGSPLAPDGEPVTLGGGRVTVSSAMYTGPGGDRAPLWVRAMDRQEQGGLIHRLLGEPTAGGLLLRGEDAVSLLRDDGWAVDVGATDDAGRAALDGFLGATDLVTYAEMVDAAAATPVTLEQAVGGWSVEVHETTDSALALCATRPSGEESCALAQDARGETRNGTTASLLVGGEWVIVVVTYDGSGPSTVQGTAGTPMYDSDVAVGRPLEGERAGEGTTVEVITVPPDLTLVEVMTMAPDQMSGSGSVYERPVG